jgi:plasmid stabilization system protein ParE
MVNDVLWTQPAEDDLESIFNYYKNQNSEEYAHELRIQILDTPDFLMLPNVIAESSEANNYQNV